MKDLVAICKALSDPNRVRALLLLWDGELCLCQLQAILGLAMSTVSAHMAVLRRAGLVQVRRKGRWMYYAINAQANPVASRAMDWVSLAGAKDGLAAEDRARLQRVIKMDKEQLCARKRS